MASPPRSVWVEVATELLAELGDWSEPVQVRIHDLRPNGQVEMELRTSESPWDPHDLVEALRLLDAMTPRLDAGYSTPPPAPLPIDTARALLVRHGIREDAHQDQAPPDPPLLTWGLHEVDPDGRWEA